jgi:glycosyltransferase involved in cell wall biosynthesis
VSVADDGTSGAAPLVSVIMPVRNCGPYIRAAIDSVLAQTYRHLELLVGDNGSTDDSFAIADELARSDARVKAFRMPVPTDSPAGPRNAAIQRAAGAYVAFLDADDLWHPRHLEFHMRAHAAIPEAALAFSEYRRFRHVPQEADPAEARRHEFFAAPSRYLEAGPVVPDIGQVCRATPALLEFIALRWCPVHTSSVTIRRAGIDPVRFPEEVSINEDLDCWVRVIDQGGAVSVPVVTSYYRSRAGSLTADEQEFLRGMARGHRAVLRERGHRFTPGDRRAYRRKIADYLWNLARLQSADGRHWAAFRTAADAVVMERTPQSCVRYLKTLLKSLLQVLGLRAPAT